MDYVVYSHPFVADFTLYKNEKIIKNMKLKEGNYFYYNKTIDKIEYTIIESKFDGIFLGHNNLVVFKPFYQYSDGSTVIEPDFVSTNLNPKTTEFPSEEWNRTFGGIYGDTGRSVQQTSDDGYILVGTIKRLDSKGMYSNDALIIKVDVNGNEQWNKTFVDFRVIPSVLHLHDGGYMLVSIEKIIKSFTVLVKTDVNVNHLPKQYFFDLGNAQSIQQTSDSGLILAGMTTGAHRTGSNAWLLKTDANGTKQWSKTLILNGSGTISSVREIPNGGYILAGDASYPEDAWLLKTDENGTEQWNRTFGGAGSDFAYSVQNTLDGGYILAGETRSYGTGGDAWLLKTDANGNEQWNKTFGLDGHDYAYSVVQTSDGGYVMAGAIDTAKNPDFKGQIHYCNFDAWLLKIDVNGNLEWSKTIGGLKRDVASFVQQTSDGGYVIAGTSESYGSGGHDIWLVKVAGMEVDTTQSQVIIPDNNVTDNNVTDNIQTSPGKSIPGFEFLGVVFLVLIILLSRRRIL